MERGVGQEGGCPVGEAAVGPGLEKGLSGGWQRGWGREITSAQARSAQDQPQTMQI